MEDFIEAQEIICIKEYNYDDVKTSIRSNFRIITV